MIKHFLIALLFAPLLSHATLPNKDKTSKELRNFCEWLIGDYTNKMQALSDSTIAKMDMHIVRVFDTEKNAIWVYLEILESKTDDIVFQRIYKIVDGANDQIEAIPFGGTKLDHLAAAWRSASPLSEVDPTTLEEETACTIYIKKANDIKYAGKSVPGECVASHRRHNAKQSLQYVTDWGVFANKVLLHEKGLDAKNQHVSGSKVAWQFKKIEVKQ